MDLTERYNSEKFMMYDLARANIETYHNYNLMGIIMSGSLLTYVFSKFIFNANVTLKMPLDFWSMTDIFCAFINMIGFSLLYTITPDDVLDYKAT